MTNFVPEYESAGQWFDDLGSAIAATTGQPVLGYSIADSTLPRSELNDIIKSLMQSGYNAYE